MLGKGLLSNASRIVGLQEGNKGANHLWNGRIQKVPVRYNPPLTPLPHLGFLKIPRDLSFLRNDPVTIFTSFQDGSCPPPHPVPYLLSLDSKIWSWSFKSNQRVDSL